MGESAALTYHRLTSYEPPNRFRLDDPRLVSGYRPMDPRRMPPQFKTYPGLASQPLEDSSLGRLLFLTAGVVRFRQGPARRWYFRAAGSAGSLAPLEVYVVRSDGVFHYDPPEHGLTQVSPHGADGLTLVITGVPWRTGWKYTERGFRHLWWDCGTMLANLLAVEPGARVELGFDDGAVAELVGADLVHELPLAVVRLDGSSPLAGGGAAEGVIADEPLEFPLVTATYRAGSDTSSWTSSGTRGTGRPWDGIDEVIRRRGSTREFAVDAPPVRPELLQWAFDRATEPWSCDAESVAEHFVAVFSVGGVDPGAYRWNGASFDLVKPGDYRVPSRHLCLDQELGGFGHYTAFHCAPIEQVVERYGERGYRWAQLEAGVVEGRLHLAAYALGYGASGLTFFDRAVSEFFATESSPMLVTAVGTPSYRPRVGGDPGRPVELAG